MRKLILILFLGIVLVSFISAEVQTIGPFQIHTNIELFQTHSNCTYNNVTSVIYPNSSIALRDVSMTGDGSNYNYTLESQYVTALGRYIINGEGDVEGVPTTWVYDFQVTTTGLGGIQFLLITFLVLALIFLIMGVKLEMEWVGFLSALMFLLGGMFITIYGFNVIANFYTQGIGITLIGIGITIMFVSVIEWLSE